MLRLICTKFDFGWGSAPDPTPDSLAEFKGPTSKERRDVKREGKGGTGERRRGRGGKKKRQGRGIGGGDGGREGEGMVASS